MASLIKNQIIKHLSKFAKNLNPDHISVDVLKGKGELHNIELNETLITEALELPAWLKIQRAVCNRVAVKIPWTSLKTLPVTLLIDEIRVEVVMSSDLRETKSGSASSSMLNSSYGGLDTGYGFANRVAEGMSLNINSLEIYFTSEVFGGSLTLNQFRVASATPFWKTATDLRQTRIRDTVSQQALLFKQVSWQLLRIEASTLGDSIATGYNINAPLRLITSQGRARITVKKSTIDGSVITGRMQIILDDLLWVATLPQVRSAISFYRYIMKLVQTASDVRKTQHVEKLLQQGDVSAKLHHNLPKQHSQTHSPNVNNLQAQTNSVFKQFDVVATSYHFYAGSIDLHICDDPSNDVKYPANWNFNSGALQISLSKLACDFYPYHLAHRERDYWVYYSDVKSRRWMTQLLYHYYKFFMSKSDPVNKQRLEREWPNLVSQCCVIRLDDFTVYCVSEATTGGKTKKVLEKLISADHEILKLPGNMPLIHVEFADYYYARSDVHLPIPPSSTHVQVNPVRIYVDLRTIRWISYIYLDLFKTLGLATTSADLIIPHADIRLEALMPRIVFPAQTSDAPLKKHNKIPENVIIQISSYVLTNCFIDQSSGNRQRLKTVLSQLENVDLFRRDFTVLSNNANERLNFNRLPDRTTAIEHYWRSLTNFFEFTPSTDNSAEEFTKLNALNDLWNFELSPVWVDFTNNLATTNKSVNASSACRSSPFLIDSPVDGWALLGNNLPKSSMSANNANGYFVVQPRTTLKVALDHFQYLFLVDALEQVSKFMVVLTEDARCFYETMEPKSFSLSCLAPLLELTLILPFSTFATTPCDSQGLDAAFSENFDAGRNRHDNVPADLTPYGSSAQLIDTSADVGSTVSGASNNLPDVQSIPEFTGFSIESDQNSFEAISSTPTRVLADDAISVNTDMSDEDQFVLLDNGEPSMFDELFPRTNAPKQLNAADVAEEACEMVPNQSQISDAISRHLQRQVAVINCQFRQAHLSMMSYDQESRLILQAPKLVVKENSDITLEDLYKLLNTKNAAEPNTNTVDPNGEYQLKLAISSVGNVDPTHLDAHLRTVNMQIGSSSLAKLADFLEVEKQNDADIFNEQDSSIPVRIKISNVDLNIGSESKAQSDSMLLKVNDAWVYQGNKDWANDLKLALEDSSNQFSYNNDQRAVGDTSSQLRYLESENAELRQKLADAKLLVQKLAQNNYNLNL